MADTPGILAKAAFKKDPGLAVGAGAYPNTPGATDLGAGHQIPFTQESLTKGIIRSRDPNLVGASAQPAAPIIAEPCSGALSGRARWTGHERLFLMALGFELPNGDDGSPMLIGTGEGTVNVTNTTNATPIVVTTSAAHGYSDGDGIRIAGVTGNTAANGDWSITSASGSVFTLVDSSGNGTHGGSATAEKYNAAAHLFEGDDTIQDEAWGGSDGRNAGFSASDRKVRRGQFGIDKVVTDYVFGSSYVNKLTLTANPNEVMLSVDLAPYARYRGSYNSASWTLASGSDAQVLFQQLEVKFGTRIAGAGSLTTVRPSSIELTIDNKLKVDDQTTESGLQFEQPVRDGFREVKVKIEFPRYNSDIFPALFDSDTEMALQMEFTGPTIASTGGETYLWGFYMSSVRFDTSAVNVAGPGRLPLTLELFAERPVTTDIFAATKYNGTSVNHDSELVVVVQNEEFQNYLTEY
jgi:hypothetical protein